MRSRVEAEEVRLVGYEWWWWGKVRKGKLRVRARKGVESLSPPPHLSGAEGATAGAARVRPDAGVQAAPITAASAAPPPLLLRLRGGRKGVAAKHTAKEEALKHKLATKNMGGGKEGLQDRLGGKAGHAKVVSFCTSLFRLRVSDSVLLWLVGVSTAWL